MNMKLYIHNILIPLALAFAAVFGLASCLQIEDGHEIGYLELPSLSVDVEVDNPAQTKALDGFVVDEPAVSEVKFSVREKGADEAVEVASWPLALTAGKTYVVEAFVGSNTFGAPYFYDSEEVTIEKLAASRPSMVLSLANSLVRVTVASEMEKHFMPAAGSSWSSSDKVSLGSAAVSEGYEASYGEWTYVPSGAAFDVVMNGVNSLGKEVEFSYSMPSEPAPRTAYDVVCSQSADWPVISLDAVAFAKRLLVAPAALSGSISDANREELVYEVSETADFAGLLPLTPATGVNGVAFVMEGIPAGKTYYVRARIGNVVSNVVEVSEVVTAAAVDVMHFTEGGNLAGTDAVLRFEPSDGGLLGKLMENGTLSISATLFRNGVAVRTSSALSGKMGGDVAGWPYLPQSPEGADYSLQVDYSISGLVAETVSVSGVKVGEPDISFTLGKSFTSYDEYVGSNEITQSVSNANSRDPETIYNVSASWSISNTLMNNSNYSKSLKFYANDVEKYSVVPTTNSCAAFSISGLTTWQKYTLKVSFIFDGEVMEYTRDHHITGLPYSAVPPKNSGNHPWTIGHDGSKYDWAGTYVKMSKDGVSGSPNIISPAFYVPNSATGGINVYVTSRAQINGLNWYISWQTTDYKASIGGIDLFSVNSGKQTGKIFDVDQLKGSGTFTSANNTLVCTSTYSSSGPNVMIYMVDIDYR